MAISARLARSVPEYSICLVRERRRRFKARVESSSKGIYQTFRKAFEGLDREHFAVITLDAKNQPIGFNVVSVGALTLAIVHPREVFKLCVLQNAAGVILAHNHCSGDPTPSPEDRRLTSRLFAAGKILGVNVLDHIIFGRDRYISFADEKWLEEYLKPTDAKQ
ncbi:MAG: JAB domain-containing protein [Nitrospira sp.]|nr:JAB domain-containing protein [Nitrospira sp.]